MSSGVGIWTRMNHFCGCQQYFGASHVFAMVNLPKGLKRFTNKYLQSHHIKMSAFYLCVIQSSSLAVHVSQSFLNWCLIVCNSWAVVCYIRLAFEVNSDKLQVANMESCHASLWNGDDRLMNMLNTCLLARIYVIICACLKKIRLAILLNALNMLRWRVVATISPLFTVCQQHWSKIFPHVQYLHIGQTYCERRNPCCLMQNCFNTASRCPPLLYMMCACEYGAWSQNRDSFVCMSGVFHSVHTEVAVWHSQEIAFHITSLGF